jgi:hypothetical protein
VIGTGANALRLVLPAEVVVAEVGVMGTEANALRLSCALRMGIGFYSYLGLGA